MKIDKDVEKVVLGAWVRSADKPWDDRLGACVRALQRAYPEHADVPSQLRSVVGLFALGGDDAGLDNA